MVKTIIKEMKYKLNTTHKTSKLTVTVSQIKLTVYHH